MKSFATTENVQKESPFNFSHINALFAFQFMYITIFVDAPIATSQLQTRVFHISFSTILCVTHHFFFKHQYFSMLCDITARLFKYSVITCRHQLVEMQ